MVGSSFPARSAFDLYATYGLPLEITQDIAQEQEMQVDEAGFRRAMEEHRLASGAGEAFGEMGGEDATLIPQALSRPGRLRPPSARMASLTTLTSGSRWKVRSWPWSRTVSRSNPLSQATGSNCMLPETGFYVESGGQVADTGTIISTGKPEWEIQVDDMRKPAAGIIIHVGHVVRGEPRQGDLAIARVDVQRRHDIMRNHTATHLLHAELRAILGEHARQAGSLVAPDRLRFDFTHPAGAAPADQLEQIEADVNRAHPGELSRCTSAISRLKQAISEGAMALFGEKYGEIVRNITIGEPETILQRAVRRHPRGTRPAISGCS